MCGSKNDYDCLNSKDFWLFQTVSGTFRLFIDAFKKMLTDSIFIIHKDSWKKTEIGTQEKTLNRLRIPFLLDIFLTFPVFVKANYFRKIQIRDRSKEMINF